MQAFMRGANLRHWLSRPDCPSVIKECGHVIDKAYGRTDDSYAIDGVAVGHAEEAPGHAEMKLDKLPAALALVLGIQRGATKANHRIDGVVYSRESTHTGNSLISYFPGGDRNSADMKYGSIQYIFMTEAGKWRFAVKEQLPKPDDITDAYARWPDYPAQTMSARLSDSLEVVETEWVRAHYCRWKIPENPNLVATLRLDNVSAVDKRAC